MCLTTVGTLVDQSTGEVFKYDPDRVSPGLQRSLLRFMTDTPRDKDGFKKWLCVLASRQQGKSVTAALGAYAKTAYHRGIYSAIIADHKERANDLFRAIVECHDNMPSSVKMPTIANRESRQLTFKHNGKIRTLSAEQNMVGIGRAVDYLLLSEMVFWPNAADAWNGLLPSIINRKEATIINECTPGQMHKPGAEWYKDTFAEARRGEGRWQAVFAPFFSSLLNQRSWDPTWLLTNEELRLLDKFGPKDNQPASNPGDITYLTLENLAFRRSVLELDREVRRNPDLFRVFYPTDSVTCWVHGGGGAIPMHAVEKHLGYALVPWTPGDEYKEYKEPDPTAIYVLAADPAGWTGGDHASFQILEVWEDQWVQAATFSSNQVDPVSFARTIIEKAERYNNAYTIVENNGVGLGTLSILELATDSSGTVLKNKWGEEKRYHLKNLYYHSLAGSAKQKPGIPAGAKTNAEALAALIDALLDKLVLQDEETVDQLTTYRRDKEVAESDKWRILNEGKTASGRRGRGHWDRISALLWACYYARRVPIRIRQKTPEQLAEEEERLTEELQKGLTYNQERALLKDYERRKKRGSEVEKKPSTRVKKVRQRRRRRT